MYGTLFSNNWSHGLLNKLITYLFITGCYKNALRFYSLVYVTFLCKNVYLLRDCFSSMRLKNNRIITRWKENNRKSRVMETILSSGIMWHDMIHQRRGCVEYKRIWGTYCVQGVISRTMTAIYPCTLVLQNIVIFKLEWK